MKSKAISYRLTADDFGLSRGVNVAIIQAHTQGALTHTSLMMGTSFTQEAVILAKKNSKLKVGLHLDLTCAGLDGDAPFERKGFLALFLKSLISGNSFKQKVYEEVERQVLAFLETGLELHHIDSHRHVHMIPAVFSVVKAIARKYKVSHVRCVNESLMYTYKGISSLSFMFDGGILKFILLKAFSLVNSYQTSTYFYSILHSCKISARHLLNLRIPERFDEVEIMLHPGNPKLDKDSQLEREQLLSDYRKIELEAALAFKNME